MLRNSRNKLASYGWERITYRIEARRAPELS